VAGHTVPLADLIDEFGIQRGVTPDVLGAHLVTSEQARSAALEPSALRPTLRGEEIKSFRTARPTLKLIYTNNNTNPKSIPNIIRHMGEFRGRITCNEVKEGKHPWWRLHRARDERIFLRPKAIGLTTTRNIELVNDTKGSIFVTDAMYVLAPRKGIPIEYILGIMQSKSFGEIYRIENQGDGRVIPQVKASKLQQIPVPNWNSENKVCRDIVNTVAALQTLADSDSKGADRTFLAKRRHLDELCEEAYTTM
jgi:hypothetical protein